MVGQTGGEGNTVAGSRLEITPVGVGDDFHQRHRISPGVIDGNISDGVSLFQILDGADHVLEPPVVSTRPNVAVPSGGGTIVSQALGHTDVGLTFPDLHVDA